MRKCLRHSLLCEREEGFGVDWGWWGRMCAKRKENCRRNDGSGGLCEDGREGVCVWFVHMR